MRIGELFSDCKHVATMKILCASVGITMPECDAQRIENYVRAGNRFFVFIDRNGIDVLNVRERSALLAKIIAGRVRRSKVLFLHDGAMREVTRRNLAETCKLITPIKPIERDDRQIFQPKKRTIFDELMPELMNRKPQKHGFSRTMNANQAMERFVRI